MRNRWIAVTSAAAATALVVGGVALAHEQLVGRAEPTNEATVPDPAVQRAVDSPSAAVPDVSTETLTQMSADGGTNARSAPLDRSRAAVSPDQALRLLGAGAFSTNGPSEMSLARVTVSQSGTELQPDPTKPSRLKLDIDDRLCWLIVFDDAEVPILGPDPGAGVEPGSPGTYKATMFVLVDAVTGEFLRAETI